MENNKNLEKIEGVEIGKLMLILNSFAICFFTLTDGFIKIMSKIFFNGYVRDLGFVGLLIKIFYELLHL